MDLDHTKKLRFGTTKSRNGCVPCKARHVKCGEEKPTCIRCIRSNRACTWASPPLRWTVIRESPPCSPLALLPTANAEDGAALEYFIRRTARQLIGTWGVSRWASTIIQCAVTDSSIQQLCIALGALQRVHEFGVGCQQYALSQYVGALQKVRTSIAATTHVKELLLLACVFFCAFECMKFHPDSASSHISSGLSLALEHISAVATQVAQHSTALTSYLLPVLTMLDNDRLLLGTQSPRPPGLTPCDVPTTFDSIQEAQHLLTGVLNTSLRGLAAVTGGQAPANYEVTLKNAQTWCQNLDEYICEHALKASDEDILSLLPMAAWRVLMATVIQVDYYEGELAWDCMLPQFRLIVDAAESFMDLTAELVEQNEDWRHPLFYNEESTRERGEQTLTHHFGGQIREGVLAGLLASATVYQTKDQSPPEDESQTGRTAETVALLLRRARSIAESRHVVGHAQQAAEGLVQIRSTFTLSHGIVHPLFSVIVRCRDPVLRKRALRLLEVCNRHEGLWNSRLAAESVKRRVMVEETRARAALEFNCDSPEGSEDIEITSANQFPNHCRVRATARSFLPNGVVLERYCLGWKGTLHEALSSGQTEEWVELRVAS